MTTEYMNKLIESIKEHGILNKVVKKRNGEVVDGKKKVEAARILGIKDIPTIIVEDFCENCEQKIP